ncbi:hypothetical protein [Halococcoides cellulosivorans]|uniref:hypothetical protein n=1 Tax=Halococcoides cellulosivorans TaxID=1679096 RepID=UPI001F2F7917|nr:hypothetical protein [Halococcoides cellulosivorans]
MPQGSVGPTLARLEGHGIVDHRAQYWTIADAEHATASAGHLGAEAAEATDGGFSDEEIAAWMETAVDPIEDRDE